MLTAIALAALAPATFAWGTYTMEDLGLNLYPTGINLASTVCGSRPGGVNGRGWYKTTAGVVTDVPLIGGGSFNAAHGISNNNKIVGWADGTGTTSPSAYVYTIGGTPAVVPGLGPGPSWAFEICRNGTYVCGWSAGHQKGWRYNTSTSATDIIDAPNITAIQSHANAIRNTGEFAGSAQWNDPPYGPTHVTVATVWTGPASPLKVGAEPTPSTIYAMNNSGRVAGSVGVTGYPPVLQYNNPTITGEQAFYGNGTAGNMNVFGPARSKALGINTLGPSVVGTYYVGGMFSHKAFIWSNANGFADLNTLVPGLPMGWQLIEATAINDDGHIVGYGLRPNASMPWIIEQFGFRLYP